MQASIGCPVCNGFDVLEIACPHCNEYMVDNGRFFDLLADYSPYRPIEDMKKSDGLKDLQTHRCPHHLYCPQCNYSNIWMVEEISLGDISTP